MTPTFKMHGSKGRTAPWISSLFPRFRRLIEPFAGRGNIFFRACADHTFEKVFLNDRNTSPFLLALRDYEGDYAFVDEEPLDKEKWLRWKEAPPSQERALAESYVARFGSSYDMGHATAGGDSENGHSRRNTIARMKRARELLRQKDAQITGLDWEEFLLSLSLREDDLVYLDPPYDVPQAVHYQNIDQDRFLQVCGELPCSVFVSGYTSERYERAFSSWGREERERASVGKGVASKGATGEKPRVSEVLWFRIRGGGKMPEALELFGE